MEGRGHVVLCNVVGGRFGCVVIGYIMREAGWQEAGHVVSVVGILAGLAARNGNTFFSVRSGHASR